MNGRARVFWNPATAIVLALLMPTVALAQQRQTFKDANGREVGRSVGDGRNTTFYDAMGRNTARSVTGGGTTITYDNFGRTTGTIRGSK